MDASLQLGVRISVGLGRLRLLAERGAGQACDLLFRLGAVPGALDAVVKAHG
jgi:hypothetical protein